MNKQVSPFAALTGAEKQIRWLEYQSIKLPYMDASIDEAPSKPAQAKVSGRPNTSAQSEITRPEPPPEVPRTLPADYQRSRHTQYDAVIARLKQAELQSRRSASQFSQQGK